MTKIFALLSQSALVTQEQLSPLAAALETQLNRDVGPRWTPGTTYGVTADRDAEAKIPDAVAVTFTDTTNEPDAEAFHSAVGAAPYVLVQVPDCPDGVSVPTSHELVETVIDWPATLWTPAPDGGPDIAYEGCDPCEDQSYEIGGVRVSNFVLPAYFTPGSSGPWDHLGLLPGPLTLSDGGYWARRAGEPTWGPRRGSRVLLPWRRGWRRTHAAPGLSRS